MGKENHPVLGTNIGLSRAITDNDNDAIRNYLNSIDQELRYLRTGQVRIEKTLDRLEMAIGEIRGRRG